MYQTDLEKKNTSVVWTSWNEENKKKTKKLYKSKEKLLRATISLILKNVTKRNWIYLIKSRRKKKIGLNVKFMVFSSTYNENYVRIELTWGKNYINRIFLSRRKIDIFLCNILECSYMVLLFHFRILKKKSRKCWAFTEYNIWLHSLDYQFPRAFSFVRRVDGSGKNRHILNCDIIFYR